MSSELARIRSLIELGRHEEAAAAAAEALTTDADNAELWAARAEALSKVEPKQALEPAQRAVAMAPDSPNVQRVLVQVNIRLDRVDEALAAIERLQTMVPHWPEPHTWRAVVLIRKIGKSKRSSPDKTLVAEARAAARRGVEAAPTWPNAHTVLGWTHLVVGEVEPARAAAATALQLDPNWADGHELMGDIHRQEGNVREAADAYVRAGKANPEHGATDRLREFQRPAAILGGVGVFGIWLVVRALTVVGRSGVGPGVMVFLVSTAVVAVVAFYLIRRSRVQNQLSSEAQTVIDLDRKMQRPGRFRRK
ncbi:MAG: tetratricopeptide repeat protein [Actinomycetota bacterium]